MSRSATWVRLAGWAPATLVGRHTAPTWETLADGGIGQVSLEFSGTNSEHQLLRRGVLLEVLCGAQPVASARIVEFDRDTGEVKAQGLSAVDLLATDMAGNVTRDVGTAVAVARSKGWNVTAPTSLTGVAAGDTTAPQTVGQLLTERAEELGMRWGVDGARRIYMRPDPTFPTYTVAPGRAAFASSNLGHVSHLLARYDDGTGYQSLTWPPGGYVTGEEALDLTDRGVLTPTQVGVILGGLLALGRNRPRWASGVTLHRASITYNGVPAVLPLLTAGSMVRITGVPQDMQVGGSPWLDVVIGKTVYTAGSDEIYIEPVNTIPSTFADVLAAS